MTKKEPKFQVGTKVIVCQDLKTEIEKFEFSEKCQEYIYWFRDGKGKLWYELEHAIYKRFKTTSPSTEYKLYKYNE